MDNPERIKAAFRARRADGAEGLPELPPMADGRIEATARRMAAGHNDDPHRPMGPPPLAHIVTRQPPPGVIRRLLPPLLVMAAAMGAVVLIAQWAAR